MTDYKVLILEDSPDWQNRAKSLLGEIPGLSASAFGTVSDAMQELKQHVPDAMLLDMRLPGGTCLPLMNAVSGKEKKPLVVVFSSYLTPQYRMNMLAAGADYVFDKGEDMMRLKGVFQEAVRQSVGAQKCQ